MRASAIDLSDYTLAELKGLLFDIDKEIRRRSREERGQAEEQARLRILGIAQDAGLSLEELLAAPADAKPPRQNDD